MFEYISVEEAMHRSGLRLVLSAGVPGPWGESAKAILNIKGIQYTAVRQTMGTRDELLRRWTGQESAPVAIYENERPRTRWDEILMLAEWLAPEPRLIPQDDGDRSDMFGLAHALCGEDGLAWNGRVYMMEAQAGRAPDPPPKLPLSADGVSIMRARYGGSWRSASGAKERMIAILRLLSARFRANRARGGRYLVGNTLSAVDIYWTAFSIMHARPVKHAHCPMPDFYRVVSEWNSGVVGEAVDPDLIEHRDYVLANHFKLPMSF